MLSPEEKKRYARHLLLPDFGEEAQLRLKSSKVLLIGAGGLGSPVALYLAAAGVGQLTIIDPDTVELSNLQRQILHSTDSVGEPKVQSAQQRLHKLNDAVTITPMAETFTVENAPALIASHDLIIDGSDNFPTRFLSTDACFFGKKPLVYGSIFQFEGQLAFFHPSDGTPCYRCLVPEVPEEGAVPNCLEAGVIGTLPGIIGSLQAMEAIKYLAGLGSPPVGKMLYYDALRTSFREIMIQKDPRCPLCSSSPSIHTLSHTTTATCEISPETTSVSAETLMERMASDPDLLLIDVREAAEFTLARIPGSQLVPLSSLEEQLSHLPREKEIYVHCQSGIRSLKAIKVLQQHGFTQLINVSDGILGWTELNEQS